MAFFNPKDKKCLKFEYVQVSYDELTDMLASALIRKANELIDSRILDKPS